MFEASNSAASLPGFPSRFMCGQHVENPCSGSSDRTLQADRVLLGLRVGPWASGLVDYAGARRTPYPGTLDADKFGINLACVIHEHA